MTSTTMEEEIFEATDAMNAPPTVDAAIHLTAAEARLQRNLKMIVFGLALLILAGLAAIVGRIIYLASGASTQPAAPSLAVAPEKMLALPAGAEVRSISLSGDRLAVHYEAAGVDGIAVFDLQTGKAITSVNIQRTP
jgi:hypothetical protein